MEKYGNYEILGEIGSGGMAQVLKARQTDLKRTVAIKRIRPHLSADKSFVEMFRNEAVIAANLNHPNIVSIYEMGVFGGSYYISMEYVDGKNLAQVIRSRKVPLNCALYIMARVLDALQFAHSSNVVHRDINPANILISKEGRVKLGDFGIARAASLAPANTSVGLLKGKLSYLSPEQVRGESVDQRSDIFAAGLVLYELLSGKKLFSGETEFAILEKVRCYDADRLTFGIEGVSPELAGIIAGCLQKNREQRYQHASKVTADIAAFTENQGLFASEKEIKALFSGAENSEAPAEEAMAEAGQRTQVVRPAGRGTGNRNYFFAAAASAAVIVFALVAANGKKKPGDAAATAGRAQTQAAEKSSAAREKEEKKPVPVPVATVKIKAAPINNADPTLASLKENKPAAKPAETAGSVYINAVPADAVIYFDNARQGEGGKALKNVKAGRHIIKITHPDYEDEIRAVEITPEKPVVRIVYRNGEITLE